MDSTRHVPMSRPLMTFLGLVHLVSTLDAADCPDFCIDPVSQSEVEGLVVDASRCLVGPSERPINETVHLCSYGESIVASCPVTMPGNDTECCVVNRTFPCKYCYQLPDEDLLCDVQANCNSYAADPLVVTECTALSLCLGDRKFPKRQVCSWTSGLKWSTTFWYSLILGGFGADRFYIGHNGLATLKMLTFGGIGIWTIVDCVLSGIGYLTPTDGSLLLNS